MYYKSIIMIKKLIVVALSVITIQNVFAQWDGIPSSVNNPISNAPLAETNITAVTDGAGGAILAWPSYNFNTNTEYIYAQRKTAAGTISWSPAAAPLEIHSTTSVVFPQIGDLVSDGAGGAYITWVDFQNDFASDIYLQRISPTGAKLFSLPGIKLNPSPVHRYTSPKLCVDAAGVIVCWSDVIMDENTGISSSARLFAQRYNTAGTPQWVAGGVEVSTVASFKTMAAIVSDASNGAIICFTDSRNSGTDINGSFDNVDIYAQRLNSTGDKLWGATDAVVANATFNQLLLESPNEATTSMISDGGGGCILVYNNRSIDNYGAGNLYAQRLNATGTRLWPVGGVPPGNINTLYKEKVKVESDGANGMVATWNENNFQASASGVYAQRITSSGTKLWGAGGVIATGSLITDNLSSTMAADGAGNYVVVWTQYDANGLNKIRGQKLNGNGALQWAAGGVDICTNPLSYADEGNIIRSTGGAMLVAWVDSRNDATSKTDIYSAKIEASGSLTNSSVTNSVTIANGNWNSAFSWAGNTIPAAGANIIIRHAIIGNINASCNSLKVESPGALTVNTGIHITVLQ